LTLECLLLCTMRSLFAIGVSAMIRGCTDVFYTMGFVQLTGDIPFHVCVCVSVCEFS
jgi:hypothetical protein